MNRRAFLISLTAAGVAPMLPSRAIASEALDDWLSKVVAFAFTPSAAPGHEKIVYDLGLYFLGSPLTSVEIEHSVPWGQK
jgi:hypothetical protein